jgi:hypothetical protein
MKTKKQPFDRNSPENVALRAEIVHGAFLREGTMAAFPTCFPGATIPIPADESRITALTVADAGIVYGGTSGRRTHLFYGLFHGATGMVFDMGVAEGANRCAAVCCARGQFFAFVNGPAGGRVVACPLATLPFDLLQEWSFTREPLRELGSVGSEPIVHALGDKSGALVIATQTRLLTLDVAACRLEPVAEVRCVGRMAIGSQGGVFGLEGTEYLWRYDGASRRFDPRAMRLPAGAWGGAPLVWARDGRTGLLYTADSEGALYAFSEERGMGSSVGRAPVAPVGPMAVTFDGRLFGFCGDGIARMFCYDPLLKRVDDLGVAVSTLQRRRYGYVFGDAVTGRDGQIFFGEDDDLGHLWLYFPRIRDAQAFAQQGTIESNDRADKPDKD